MMVYYKVFFLPLQPLLKHLEYRKDGRVVDYSSLENYRAERHRGFESLSFRKRYLSLRHLMKREPYGFPFLCLKMAQSIISGGKRIS